MILRPPRSTPKPSSAASDVYKRQGVKFRTTGEPVLYLSNPKGVSREVRRGLLDDLAKLNEMKFREVGDPEITTRISQYEMAYRMQMSVPELTDLSDEPDHVFDLYGKHSRTPGTYAANCSRTHRTAAPRSELQRHAPNCSPTHRTAASQNAHGAKTPGFPTVSEPADQSSTRMARKTQDFPRFPSPVSYTHLRAHETDS